MSKLPVSKGMVIDGVAASECVDTSGESISIKGVDCSQMDDEDAGILIDWEHVDGDVGAHSIVGRLIFLKKIYELGDCDDDRQRDYFEKCRRQPLIYVIARLFDGSGHENAKAIAAIIRDNAAHGEKIAVRFSIEGTTLKKEGNRIVRCIFRKLAATVKPANKTAVSGLLEDNAVDTKKSERAIDPRFTPLGGSIELEVDPIVDAHTAATTRLLAVTAAFRVVRKAIEAGNHEGAPSTRTGGSALQREDDSLHNLNGTAFAALRDYGWSKPYNRQKFKTFAKAKLPEVSPEFLDHFADVAEGLALKRALIKREADKPKLPKKPSKAPAVIIPAQHQAVNHAVLEDLPDEDEAEPAGNPRGRNISSLTYRGKALKPNPGMTRPVFDPKKGILHTPAGSIRAYLPEHDGADAAKHYEETLRHPDIESAMDTATTNWSRLHKLFKAGKLPPEVIMHAVMFSQLSPTKPVPTQEIQYARLADAMDATGIDPRYPGFHEIEEPYRNLDQPNRLPHTAREEFARNPAYYQGGKIGVETDSEGNPVGKVSHETGRRHGELLSASPLFNDFMSRATQYHTYHDKLVNLIQKHRGNGFDATAELLAGKQAALNARNTRRTAIKAGRPDPGAPEEGANIPGLKVKTGLYTLGMLGNGDSVVPDTHFIRNMYGLDIDKDGKTINYLKQLHWRTSNMEPVMRNLNAWYLQHHPAVQHTLNHPKWGSTFERPEDALFPSFWRHWLTIQPHERFVGLPNYSENAATTHAPYWEAIRPHVDDALEKSVDEPDSSVALRTAMVHQQYVKDYGEMPAMFLFMHHLAPKLLDAAARRRKIGNDLQFLAKARAIEAELIELRKDVQDTLDGPKDPDVRAIHLKQGNTLHPAGRFIIHDNQIHHLEDYHNILHTMLPEGPINAVAVSRLHGLQWAPHLVVNPHHVPPAESEAPAQQHPTIQVAQSLPPPPQPVFEYKRPGMSKPHVVEFGPQGAALDGKALSDAELQLMLRNASSGLASIRYHHASLNKAEEDYNPESDLAELVRKHPESADEIQRLRTHLFVDPMVSGVGNQYAWNKFASKNQPGVYLSIDGNDLKSVNDIHGHEAGHAAIRGLGGALRAASNKTGGGKLFRAGGDEFVAHFPTYEHASRFLRHAREHLDALPPINGVHRVSAAFGLGNDFPTADRALYAAKAGKIDPVTKQRAFPVGKTPSMAHSLVPGAEGPLPMHDEAAVPHIVTAAKPVA